MKVKYIITMVTSINIAEVMFMFINIIPINYQVRLIQSKSHLSKSKTVPGATLVYMVHMKRLMISSGMLQE